ncbi:MAG TPA: hypothetical protein VLD57_01915 [Blastocatellia bacterium]|nr:hypothetical protein [Blastocatellia bacterium]
MFGELLQLSQEVEQAEQEFSSAVLRYLLILANDEATISGMHETIIRYRSALEKLNGHLAMISNGESSIPAHNLDLAVRRLRQRDIALKALLLRTGRILSDRSSLK